MGNIVNVSVSEEDMTYIKKLKLSPTQLLRNGVMMHRAGKLGIDSSNQNMIDLLDQISRLQKANERMQRQIFLVNETQRVDDI